MGDLSQITRLTDKALWRCECGVEKSIKIANVIDGNTISCGCTRSASLKVARESERSYDVLTPNEWRILIPELVDQEFPERWSLCTNRMFSFRCKCGKTFNRKFNRYNREKSTCGRCTEVNMVEGYQVNKFIYMGNPITVNSDSSMCAPFKCECGRVKSVSIRHVFSGVRKTCGRCDLLEAIDIAGKFGKLTLVKPRPTKKSSKERLTWRCDCGTMIDPPFFRVFTGKITCCENCRRPLKVTKLEVTEPVNEVKKVEPARIRVRTNAIKLDRTPRSGPMSEQIAEYLNELGFETIENGQVGRHCYGVMVEKAGLLIDCYEFSRSYQRGTDKYVNASENKYDFIGLFEDELSASNWPKVKNLLRNRLKVNRVPRSIRPQKCEVRMIHCREADEFYDQFHYIGACKSSNNYGVFYEDELIGCASFKHPTRQSQHPWELVRMASHEDYRVHGIWGRLINQFIQEHQPKSLVSFSDNRLFSGNVYQKIGFTHDGDIPSDYYWCRDGKRFHKSGLRKKQHEKESGLTEYELREAQGYTRVWDLGKKRWLIKREM